MGTDNTDLEFVLRMQELILSSTRYFDLATNRRYDRYYATRYANARYRDVGGDIDEGILYLDADLQALSTLTNGDATAIDLSDVLLMPDDSAAAYYTSLQWANRFDRWISNTDNPRRSITITGYWGYGGRWTSAKVNLTASVDDNVTEIPLTGLGPLEWGRQIRIGEEFMFVEDVSEVDDTAIVVRGHNGTTAVDISAGATVYVFDIDPLVKRTVTRLAQWSAEHDESPVYGVISVGEEQQTVDLSVVPKDIQSTIKLLRRPTRIRSV
jgi:hypothetical protein